MELDFDKEINALLRQTVKQESLFVENDLQTAHLDADEISAFAENVIPEKAKTQYTEHLADCDRCRKSLSELIILNSEAEVETHATEAIAIAPIETPWYRKLFVFPGLAYAMGGLVIAFTGLTAFVLLQNFNSGSFEMAKSNTSSQTPKSSDRSSENQSFNTNSMVADANTAAVSNMAQDEIVGPIANPEIDEEDSIGQKNQNGPYAERNLPGLNRDDDRGRNEGLVGAAKPAAQPEILSESKPADKSVLDGSMKDAEPPRSVEPLPAPAPKTVARKNEELSKRDQVLTTRGAEADTDEKKESKLKTPAEARQTNGKTFNRKDGVWYDSAYQNQKTKNVRRGTNDYKNLDSGLRAIADKFAETLVIVWKQTAYRIQ